MSRYRIRGLLGKGGMASVFEASRILPGNQIVPVACKAMLTTLCDNKRYLEMFYHEAALNLQISCDHPGLVTVYDCFEDEEARPYLIMELVQGCSLADLRDEHDSIPFEVVRRILDAMLDALAFVHSKQIIHRDISPGNVLLSTEGLIKLSDFGIAKHIPEGYGQTGTFRGTDAYASPEALRCDPIDARSDLFSVGAVLYEMITGCLPFGYKPTLDEILMRLVDGKLARLPGDVPSDLRDLALGWLQPDPADRHPATAKQALTFLRGFKQPMATRQELAALVKPIFEQRAARREDSRPGSHSRPGNTLEVPVFVHRPDGYRRTLRADSPPDEDEKIVTQSGQRWQIVMDDDDDMAERSSESMERGMSRLVVALSVALAIVLSVAVTYWLSGRGKAGPDAIADHAAAERSEALPGDDRNGEVPAPSGPSMEQGQAVAGSVRDVETSLSSPALDAQRRTVEGMPPSDHSRVDASENGARKGGWRDAPVGGKPPAGLGLPAGLLKEDQP